MSPGVVSLRCPSCGRPFLSLPQQTEALVTCPHCAQSAPRSSFSAAAEGLANATTLPLKRRVIQQPAAAPAPTQPVPSAFLGGSLPWAAAAEQQQPPTQSPVSAAPFSTPFPPAPPASAPWQMPQGNAAPSATAYFQPHPERPPAAPAELHPIQTPPPRQAWVPSQAPAFRPAAHQNESDNEDHAGGYRPRREERNIPLGLFIVLMLAFGGWVAWQQLQPPLSVDIPVVESPLQTAPHQAATVTTAPTPTRGPTPPLPPTAVPKAAGSAADAAPVPEVRRAEVPALPVPTTQTASKMLHALLTANTPEERATLVADAEDHRADMAEFFAKPAPIIRSLTAADLMPHVLPGQTQTPLFQVITDKNANGAFMRVISQPGGGFLLDWPLFAETHSGRLKQFLQTQPADPAWFYAGVRRTHALDLSAEITERHLTFDVQGSASGAVRTVALVQKETPLGRFFNRETGWGTVYLARLLLQFRVVSGGTKAVIILDCEGASTGAAEGK